MSQRKQTGQSPRISTSSASSEAASSGEVQALRVDAAHPASDGQPPAAQPAPASAPALELDDEAAMLAELAQGGSTYSAEQVQNQSLQLAGLLKERQRQLDRRETELNAQTAKLEKELRTAQMWSRERQYELQQRELKHQQQAEEFKERQQGMHSAQSSLSRELQARQAEVEEQAARLVQRDDDLKQREADLERRLHEFELARAVRQSQTLSQQREQAAQQQRLEHRRLQTKRMFADMSRQLERRRAGLDQLWEQREAQLESMARAGSAEVDQALAELADRKQALNEHAALLDDQQAELQQQRELLAEAREKLALDTMNREQSFTEEKRKWLEARRESEAQLKRRRESLDQRTKSLQTLHEEVNARNRESLELRLGVEQIWNQLAGKAAPAELTQRLGQYRARLAEQQRDERLVAERRRKEIIELAADLQRKQAVMREKQQEIERWLAHRTDDLEAQAARLVAREQELDRQENQFKEGSEQWSLEKQTLQQQIRRLQSHLRKASSDSVVIH